MLTYSWHDSCETGQQNMDCQHCCHSNPTASHASAAACAGKMRPSLFFYRGSVSLPHKAWSMCLADMLSVSDSDFSASVSLFWLSVTDTICRHVVMLEPDALLSFCSRVLCKGLLLCNFALPKKFIALASEFVMKRSRKSSL